MTDLNLVFFGFTLTDLALAAGRYLILVASTLLVIKNVTWLVRWGRHDRRAWRRVRVPLETLFAASLVVIYGRHLYFGGDDLPAAVTRLSRTEAGVIVWVLAGILITLLMSRKDDSPRER